MAPGPIKPTVPHPNANYAGQPHEQMQQLVTQNYNPETATTVSDAWKTMGNTFKELATDFSILVNGSQDGWKGRAAEGVRAALGKVGTFSDQTGEAFTRTASAIEQQRDAAVQANKSMPAPVEFNPMKIAGDWLTNKGGFISPVMMVGAPVEMISTYNKQQGAKEEAVQVMQTRDNTMMAAAMSMPTMESTPQVTQDQGVTQTSSSTNSQSLSNVNGYRPPANTGMPGMPPGSNNGTTNPSWVAPQTKDPNLPGNYDPNRPPGGGDRNRPPGIPNPGPFPPGRIALPVAVLRDGLLAADGPGMPGGGGGGRGMGA
ncbi:PPE domain-containing protein, partial [Lentzea sp. PSKA42]|nr:PPE domain-containing protein [Lentzea indica]